MAANVPAPQRPTHVPVEWVDRDRSLLDFHARVLHWAQRDDVPLLERVRYLAIVAGNLDEFFEVRAALYVRLCEPQAALDAIEPAAQAALSAAAHRLVEEQYAVYHDRIVPALEQAGIHIIPHRKRSAAQKRWVKAYFDREVRPLLLPIGLDPAHPFPQVASRSLNFIVRLAGKDAFGRVNEVAILKVPKNLPRIVRLPKSLGGKRILAVTISSVIRAHLPELFTGRTVVEFAQFRVTRHSDLSIDEADARNLRTALRQGLEHRNYGQSVRLEVSADCSPFLLQGLLRQFALPASALYPIRGPLNLVWMHELIALVQQPRWLFPHYEPTFPRGLLGHASIFERLRAGDVLLHHPFESFDGVLAFLREAVSDPDVLVIKQTIYRTGTDSALMELLRQAVQRGKEVTVVVEIKARFDEEANLHWAEQLESIGALVVYGVVGLKTHAKMLLVSRRESRGIRRYAHLSTGNYNPRTAAGYTDLGYLTSRPDVTADVENVFALLSNQSRIPKLNKLILAPFSLQRYLLEWIDRTAQAALSGRAARIIVKVNALTDEKLMDALVRAGQAGVGIDLLVRGACMLPAQIPGKTDRIRVRSIVGRFLEHSRIFSFLAGEEEVLLLSSADWMNRNMLRRVELAWPIDDPALRERIRQECLQYYLDDRADAWDLQGDGRYVPVQASAPDAEGAQAKLMATYRAT
ncbi:polyphosphate kinase 1 [Candidatus Symbiobacter mobilis]|uniref:Polyphosphate kinase n=1 Tax=Candidatus Symbiobacter mobilis CR TaxID=946483 RepID=U5NAR6_9BURK|nr:polyphosphate kinase 1 [Candidatus Symbiobacter mobilis]AGX88666.1 polyphosphate kinase [Candidatus Symbiobacter mobilis CR]